MLKILIRKDWAHIKRRLRLRFPHLGPEDFLYLPGREEELITRLERKTHLSEAELTKFVEDAVMAAH